MEYQRIGVAAVVHKSMRETGLTRKQLLASMIDATCSCLLKPVIKSRLVIVADATVLVIFAFVTALK